MSISFDITLEGLPKYEVPASIKSFIDLTSKEPPLHGFREHYKDWQSAVSRWTESRGDSFYEKRGVNILTDTKRLPWNMFEKVVMTNSFQELPSDRRVDLMNRAVEKVTDVQQEDVVNLVMSGFGDAVLKNKFIDLNVFDPASKDEVHPALPLLLQHSAEKRGQSRNVDPVITTVESLIYLQREIPLSSKTLSSIIQSPEFSNLPQGERKRLCEEIAILHSKEVFNSRKLNTSRNPGEPTLFDLVSMNTLGSSDYVIALTSIEDINVWRERMHARHDHMPLVNSSTILTNPET